MYSKRYDTAEAILNMNIVKYYRGKLLRYRFKKEVQKLTTLDETISFVFSFKYFMANISPVQIKNEMRELILLLQESPPKVLVEIGTANGGSLFLLARVAQIDATIISIDLPEEQNGYPMWRIPLYESFALPSQDIHLLKGDSHDTQILNQVGGILAERKIDFLFIDGDHTYAGVKKDYEMYSPLVKKGGKIAFHDIVPGAPEKVGGVPKLWCEIRDGYAAQKRREIVDDWQQRGYGIGVLLM